MIVGFLKYLSASGVCPYKVTILVCYSAKATEQKISRLSSFAGLILRDLRANSLLWAASLEETKALPLLNLPTITMRLLFSFAVVGSARRKSIVAVRNGVGGGMMGYKFLYALWLLFW